MTAPKHFLVHAAINEDAIAHSVGMPEYSYYFVMRDFLPVLDKLGVTHVLDDPSSQAPDIIRACRERGEPCVFLHFTAPHNFLDGLDCPAFHVFAWEFNTIPTESWMQNGLNDWRIALRAHKGAITHSQYAVKAVKTALGEDYPIASVPSPVWDKMTPDRAGLESRSAFKNVDFLFYGRVFDTRQIELFTSIGAFGGAPSTCEPAQVRSKVSLRKGLAALFNGNKTPEPPAAPDLPAEQKSAFTEERQNAVSLNGVVYTSIFNPLDGRKNWQDMISAFIWAHKRRSDAVLVIKTPKLDVHDFVEPLIEFLKRFQPFDCRIVILKAYLDEAQYRALLHATTYYVNTSYGEGQCLPLMEYLSAGVPAVAPATTALADYITPRIAFPVSAHAEPSTWQHDPRLSYRALRYRVDWLDLVNAFAESYDRAVTDEAAWRTMGAEAAAHMESHCSQKTAEGDLKAFLSEQLDWRWT